MDLQTAMADLAKKRALLKTFSEEDLIRSADSPLVETELRHWLTLTEEERAQSANALRNLTLLKKQVKEEKHQQVLRWEHQSTLVGKREQLEEHVLKLREEEAHLKGVVTQEQANLLSLKSRQQEILHEQEIGMQHIKSIQLRSSKERLFRIYYLPFFCFFQNRKLNMHVLCLG